MKQRVDSLGKGVRKQEERESLEFSLNGYDDKLQNMGDKVQKLDEEI